MSRSRTETRKRSGVQFASSSDEDDQGNLQRVFSHNPSNPISSRTPSVASDDPNSALSQSPESPFASLGRAGSKRYKLRARQPSYLGPLDVSVPSSPSYVGSARSSLDSHRPEVGALLSANHLSESPTRLGPERTRETPPVSAHDGQASTVNWPPHWAQGLNPFTTPRITIDHKPFGEKAPAGSTAGFGSEAWSPTHRWGEGRILNEKQTKEKEMLEAEVTKDLIDLALGVVAYNYRKNHAASAEFKEDAVFLDEIAETFRGDKLLDKAADLRLYGMIDPTGLADALFDQEEMSHKDALWQEMVFETRRTLMARSRIDRNANEARKDLTSAIDQHVHTAEYLVGDHLYFGAGLAHSDMALLGSMRGTYATSGSHGTQQELEMLREVTHGTGKRLRDRMWAIMGWSITAGFNSRVRDVDWAGTPEDPQDDVIQTSLDHASCLIQRFLPSRNQGVASKEEHEFAMKRIGASLHLLPQNWSNEAWHGEGRRIASVPLDDAFRAKSYSSLDNLADLLDPELDRKKLRHATALQNYWVLAGTLLGDARSAAVERSALQLCLNTRYVQSGPRGEVIGGPGSDPCTFSDGIRQLLGAVVGTEDVQDVLTGSEDVAKMRKYLDDYIRMASTPRWKPNWWADNTPTELEPCTSGSMDLVKPEPKDE